MLELLKLLNSFTIMNVCGELIVRNKAVGRNTHLVLWMPCRLSLANWVFVLSNWTLRSTLTSTPVCTEL